MGPEDSATRFALMDAVEAVMREQGYAALSARSVAARAGLKYQLVFYYFKTMDDLLLAAYRRRTQTVLEQLEQALNSEAPLHSFWEASSNPFDAALSLEYMAMSNHNQVIRAETMAFGERFRRNVAEKLATRLKTTNLDPTIFSPLGLTVAINLMGSILGFDSALGISGGHRDVETIVAWCLRQLEPDAVTSKGGPASP